MWLLFTIVWALSNPSESKSIHGLPGVVLEGGAYFPKSFIFGGESSHYFDKKNHFVA